MTEEAIKQVIDKEIESKSQKLFHEMLGAVHARTDHLFANLLICEWIAGLLVALVVSPRTWYGAYSDVHIHVYTAILLGGLILARPIYLALKRPGRLSTRNSIAIGQMLWAALLIHLTGGRIESHFLIFGSLAFLSFYRDRSVLVYASAVVVIDHIARGIFFPMSIYGVNIIEPWRWIEHAWWVIFEVYFLFKLINQNLDEMREISRKQAELTETRESIERVVELKTRQLKESQMRASTDYRVAAVLSNAKNLGEAAAELMNALISGLTMSVRYSIVLKEYEAGSRFTKTKPSDSTEENETQRKTLRFFCRSNREQPSGSSDDLMLCLKLPIESNMKGGLMARMEVYTEAGGSIDEADQQMLKAVAGQLADFLDKRATEAENEHLAYLVQSSGDAIVGVNLDGTLSSWNNAAEILVGYQSEHLIGFPYLSLIPEGRRQEQEELFRDATAGILKKPVDTEILNGQGKCIDVSITMAPVMDENHQILGCSVILRDITDRKLAEKRVAEFYSIVSHELRTPLTSIRAVLGLIEGGIVEPGSGEAQELVQVARASADRLIRLINDMLDLKKIEAGKMDMDFEPTSTRELVESCLQALTGMAEEAEVSVSAEHSFERLVRADRDKATQVLTNLVANGIKFSPPGQSVLVKVSKGETPAKTGEETVRFSVYDRGPGIAEADKVKLFEKFQQLDASDSREKGGTGLGLAISKAIVEQHKGSIGVDSSPGQGSCFWFELPLAQDSNTTASAPPAKTDLPVLPRSVLLVEDDQGLSTVLTHCLTNAGYRVEQAFNLAEARICLKNSPSVILLDVRLPDGNGLSLIEEIKAEGKTKDIPIIVISGEEAPPDGYGDPEGNNGQTDSGKRHFRPTIQKGSARVLDWLRKPFTEEELTRAVVRATKPSAGKRILVVDDDPGLCKVIETQLVSLGMACVLANDGLTALRLAKDEQPNLIILDVNLPQLNAFEILGALKEGERKATPLIIYTGQDLSREQKQELTLGLTRHLSKRSAGQEDLLQAVQTLLSDIELAPGQN